MYCPHCEHELTHPAAMYCPHCNLPLDNDMTSVNVFSPALMLELAPVAAHAEHGGPTGNGSTATATRPAVELAVMPGADEAPPTNARVSAIADPPRARDTMPTTDVGIVPNARTTEAEISQTDRGDEAAVETMALDAAEMDVLEVAEENDADAEASLPATERNDWRAFLVLGAAMLVIIGAIATALLVHHPMGGSASATAVKPTAVPETIIYQSAMTVPTGGWLNSPTACGFATDGYHVQSNLICNVPLAGMTNIDYSVTAQAGTTNATVYGILVHHSTTGDGYAFLVNNTGAWTFEKVVNGKRSILIVPTKNPVIKTGTAANTLRILAVGNVYQLFINGTRVAQVTDTSLPNGQSAVIAIGDAAIYTNVTVALPLPVSK